MPIPPFTIDGILPPYVGIDGPGGAPNDMSPYVASVPEVVATLATTEERKDILRGWLQHRAQLRALGFSRGFQWLDGSFVEQKDPKDLDVVTFLYRPAHILGPQQLGHVMAANLGLFSRAPVKQNFKLDAFFLDLNGDPRALVNSTRYYLGLFSHRRVDDLWKGMLEVSLDSADDVAALAALGQTLAPVNQVGVP